MVSYSNILRRNKDLGGAGLQIFDSVREAANKTAVFDRTRYHHSSIIVSPKNKILAVGRNHFNGGTLLADDGRWIDKTVHSEIHALARLDIRKLTGAILVNYGRTNISTITSRPCLNCWAVLQKLNFKKVIYSIHGPINGPHKWKEELF